MPGSSIYINQIDLDPNFFVWGSGQDIRKFNGTNWEYYDSSNSAVPSGFPYYLDTRSVSIDNKGILWGGIAQSSTGIAPPTTEDSEFYNQRIAGGFDGSVTSIIEQNDGKIIIGGQFTQFDGNPRTGIVRLNQDGTEDTSFYSNLISSGTGTGFDGPIGTDTIKLQSDGKIIISGFFFDINGNIITGIVRLNPDGTEDTSFYSNLGTGFNGLIFSISVQIDDKILVGGTFTDLNGTSRNWLVRLNSDGTEDTSFCNNLGTGFSYIGPPSFYFKGIYSMTQQEDGKILVGGSFTRLDSLVRNRLIRLNSDGTEDIQFYNNLNNSVSFDIQIFSITLQEDKKILVGGSFIGTYQHLIRLNSNGTIDNQFYSNLISTGDGTGILGGSVFGTFIQQDGKIMVYGDFTDFNNSGGSNRNGIIRLNSDGTEDSQFYSDISPSFEISGSPGSVYCLDIQTNKKVLIGGNFTEFISNSRNYNIRLNPSLTFPQTPLVFKLDTSEVSVGESWYPSDLASFDNSLYEASLVYSSPYGSEVLTFVTPLNGNGIIGATSYTRINGVTGGRLFFYDENIEKWNETLEGYTWPHIFQIKAKGYKGKEYKYFLGTTEGLWVIPPGILSTLSLNEGGEIVKQAKVYNTNTSGIISNKIYTLDFDENGNLWIGTDLGLSFFDGNKFWNYETNGPVTYLKTRENGHIFYSIGDGELSLGTGLWHFNGTTHTNLNSSNSDLPNDNILGIDLIENGTKQGDITLYENSLWILSLNDLSSFVYDLPHVYASSKNEGATGWNFTYHVPQGATGETGAAPLPKLNKYTWSYPELQVYDSEFVSQKLPGLDSRNLFLTVPLKDIADGKAGEQYYWSNSPVESFDEKILSKKIGSPLWDSQITIGGSGDVKITCSTSVETEFGTKYFVGGYLSGSVEASFGYYNDLTPATIQNLNPTIGGSGGTAGNSSFYGEMGFIVSYDYSGSVDTILPFRGYKTRIDSLDPSPDNNSIAVSGSYNWFIESGPWIWHSWEGANTFSGNGVTGSPYGATNINYPGLTSGTYDWIYDPLVPDYLLFLGDWIYNPGSGSSIGSGEFDFEYSGTGSNLSDVTGMYISFFDSSSVDYTPSLESLVTSFSFSIPCSPDSYYTITSISSITGGLFIGLSYQSGNSGSVPFSPLDIVTLSSYEWNNLTYPLVKNILSSYGDKTYGIFTAEIQRDLGNKFSFTGITGDYNLGINSTYRVTKFRNFPAKDINTLPNNNLGPVTSVQLTNYYTHLLVESNLSGNFADLSTLKNEWNRSNDSNDVDNYLSDSAYTGLLSYVKLSNLDYSLQENYNSNTPGATGGWVRTGSEINSLDLGESVVISGSGTGGFYFSGNYLSPTGSYNSPYYISITKNPIGSTGFYLESFGNTGNKIGVTKDESSYYVTTITETSGSYFGKNFTAESDTTYFLTAQLTEQGICKNIFYPSVTGSLPSLDLKTTLKLSNGQFIVHYENYDDPYTVKILKTDDFRTDDTFVIEGFNGDLTICNDMGSNLFVSGFNSLGLTANGYVSFGYVDVGYFIYSSSGFSYLLKQYEPNLGINEGNIISRPGSNPWVWCDSHVKEEGSFEVPLMSTVIFNNYSSEIYGKNTNKWILTNSYTEEEILNIKYSPYFIFTFTQEGDYTIYNEVSDSQGNVYATTGNGFIKVIDHKKMRIPGRKTGPINSSNYGVDQPFEDRSHQTQKLAKDLGKQQKEIQDKNKVKFSSAIVIPDNPDLTYRKIKTK